ncbi:MAG: nucleotidyltransferase domain-containing protein [Candidatus Nanoarchaeia archaeon]
MPKYKKEEFVRYTAPKISLPSAQIPQPPITPASPEVLKPAGEESPEEQIKKLKEQMNILKEKCEKFKAEALKSFKQIQSIALLPPKEKDGKPVVFVLVALEGTDEEKLKKKDEIEKKLEELGTKTLPGVETIMIVSLDEVWNACFAGKYDILKLFTIAFPIYDSGWLGILKLAEIHKSLVLKELEKYVVCYVLAGSLMKGKATETSDVDTFVVIDDTDVTRMTAPELKARLYSMILGLADKAAMVAGVKNRLHVQVYILTEMWDNIRSANAVIFTFLRDGVPLYDRGMFQPWRLLLKQGKIIPTPEAVDSYIKSGQQILNRTKYKLREIAQEDFFWACLNPSQGILMLVGIPPKDPRETPQMLREVFVKQGLLEEKWPDVLEKIIQLRKDIEHGKLKEVSAKDVEEAFSNAEAYLKRLDRLAKDLEIKQIRKKISELYDKTLEDVMAALAVIGVRATEFSAIDLFKTNLVAKKLAPARFLDILTRIVELKKEPKTNLYELDSLYFEEDRLAKATFDLIRAEKGKKIEKFKISATYAKGTKKADIWLLSNIAYIIKDTSDPKTPILKYSIDKDGNLVDEKPATLKEIDAALEKFAGSPTQITRQTIDSLKKILKEDLQIVIGA